MTDHYYCLNDHSSIADTVHLLAVKMFQLMEWVYKARFQDHGSAPPGQVAREFTPNASSGTHPLYVSLPHAKSVDAVRKRDAPSRRIRHSNHPPCESLKSRNHAEMERLVPTTPVVGILLVLCTSLIRLGLDIVVHFA